MKKDALISRSKSGLNIYMPEELRAHLGKHRLAIAMTPASDGGGSIRLFPDASARNRVAEHTSPLHPLRISLKELPREIETLGLFGATPVAWDRGETPGEVWFTIPAEQRLAAPRIVGPRRDKGKTRTAAPAKAPAIAPHVRLRELLTELNALLTSGAVDDVELTARSMLAERGGTEVKIGGPIKGQRIEEFG